MKTCSREPTRFILFLCPSSLDGITKVFSLILKVERESASHTWTGSWIHSRRAWQLKVEPGDRKLRKSWFIFLIGPSSLVIPLDVSSASVARSSLQQGSAVPPAHPAEWPFFLLDSERREPVLRGLPLKDTLAVLKRINGWRFHCHYRHLVNGGKVGSTKVHCWNSIKTDKKKKDMAKWKEFVFIYERGKQLIRQKWVTWKQKTCET